MKQSRKNELDVDLIGGQEPLTKEEMKAVNDYIVAKKTQPSKLPLLSKKRTPTGEKSLA